MKLKIAEHFHSIQGEGKTAGRQAVFLRLQSCNLLCGGAGTVKDGELHDGAKWRCDTIETWLEGEKYSISEAITLIENEYAQMLKNGSHLIITGGEPLLQQKQIITFLIEWGKQTDIKIPFIEIETNGTIMPAKELILLVDLFNVSPKLINSGMPERRRIKPQVLFKLSDLSQKEKAIFKFVVFDQSDMEEIQGMIHGYEVSKSEVYLMPACSNRQEWEAKKEPIVDLCKKFGYNFSPRLQIVIYNKTVGV